MPLEEDDELIFGASADVPSVAGAINYNATHGLRARDAVGTYRLRGTIHEATVTAEITAGANVGGTGGGGNLSAQLPDLSTGDFVADYDIFLNGKRCRGSVTSTGKDYYAGTDLTLGQLKFEYALTALGVADVITVVKRG
jgi:hypothetical protein